MRRFHSYGPVDHELHFSVPRRELVDRCLNQLIGNPVKGGHYFTIWAPRQTGKTWLMRQVKQEITQRDGDQFTVYHFSLGNLRGLNWVPPEDVEHIPLPKGLSAVLEYELPGHPTIEDWEAFLAIFSKDRGLWDRPLILLIDEADTALPALLDLIAGRFRELYLNREPHWLHGLALIGVRAVLGIESQRGSPFNIQRSLHVPNLTAEEVRELYRQYQEESGQPVTPEVVEAVYTSTNGQPGLVSWFGELLTETYNPGSGQPIDLETWKIVWLEARFGEPNNTVMNLVAKARMPQYQEFLTQLFTQAELPFAFHDPLLNYLYLHGILETESVRKPNGETHKICRFSSPFVQHCLYDALRRELVSSNTSVLVLDPFDELEDVFAPDILDLPALLRRYKDYLARLKTKGINPWKDQPRRKTDFQLTEAVGHFHLFTWLRTVVGRRCVLSPEFPTGNGKVDLHLRCGEKRGIIEVKSFVDAYRLKEDRGTAADYARNLGYDRVTMAVFIPMEDETVLAKLSGETVLEGVQVTVVAIGWV